MFTLVGYSWLVVYTGAFKNLTKKLEWNFEVYNSTGDHVAYFFWSKETTVI
jgi:hypothetical protein